MDKLKHLDPNDFVLVIRQDMPEDDMQKLREQFPKVVFYATCLNHFPAGTIHATFPSLEMPPCAVKLSPDESISF